MTLLTSDSPLEFRATGSVQTFVVPATASYIITACGAQGGGDGGRGARLQGTFFLNEGEVLQLLIGKQGTAGTTPHQPAGGGGGGTFVWRSRLPAPLPDKPLLAAGGGGGGPGGGPGLANHDGGFGAAPGGRSGHGGESDPGNFRYSGGGGAGWYSGGHVGSTPTFCGGGTLWHGGAGANYCAHVGGTGGFGGGGGGAFLGQGTGGGGGYSGGGGGSQGGPAAGGGGSFNSGAAQINLSGAHEGDGCVTLQLCPLSAPTHGFGVQSGSPFPFEDLVLDPNAPASGLEGKGFM